MKRNKVPNFYIAIFLIVVITVSTFSIVKIEENLYQKEIMTKLVLFQSQQVLK